MLRKLKKIKVIDIHALKTAKFHYSNIPPTQKRQFTIF